MGIVYGIDMVYRYSSCTSTLIATASVPTIPRVTSYCHGRHKERGFANLKISVFGFNCRVFLRIFDAPGAGVYLGSFWP